MGKKIILPLLYIGTWLLLFGLSVAQYANIWAGRCYFLTAGWLLCNPTPSRTVQMGLLAAIVGMFAVFMLMSRRLWDDRDQSVMYQPWLQRALLGIGVLAIFVLPLGTIDTPYYFSAGKALHEHINPYVSNWVHQVDFSPAPNTHPLVGFSYGPVITQIFSLLYELTGGSAALFLLAWKALMFVSLVAAGWLTVKTVKLFSPGATVTSSWYVLWLALPILTYEWVVEGHFDGLWLFTVLLAIYSAKRKWWWLVLPALIVGTWIKFLPLLIIPFFVLWWWQDISKTNWKKPLGSMVGGTLLAAVITVLAWRPYWAGSHVFDSLVTQSKWAVNSFFSVVYYSLWPLFERLFGSHAHLYLTSLSQGALLMLLLYLLFPIIKHAWTILWHRGRWQDGQYVQAILIFFAVYLIVWQKSFWSWYGTWFLPIGLIAYEATHFEVTKKIVRWFTIAPFIFQIGFIAAWFLGSDAGSALWFYWLVFISILAYPLYLLFKWRQQGYNLETV